MEYNERKERMAQEQKDYEDVLHKIANHLEAVVFHLRLLLIAAWIIFGFWAGWFIGEVF